MATLATINIKAVLDAKGIQQGAQQGKQALDSFASRGGGALSMMAGKIGGFVAAAATIGGAVMMFNRGREAIDGMAKAADRLGLTVETMQGLALAGDLAGNSSEEFINAMSRMSGVLDDAILKGGDSAKSFERLGLSVGELARMTPDEQFLTIGEAINNVANTTERTALAMDIFGKSGGKFLSFFKDGRAAVADSTKLLEEWGVLLTEQDTTAVESMNDAWTTMTTLLSGISNKFIATIAPAASAFLQTITDLLAPTEGIEALWADVAAWVELAAEFAVSLLSTIVGWSRITTAATSGAVTAIQWGIAQTRRFLTELEGGSTAVLDKEIERLEAYGEYYANMAKRGIEDMGRGLSGAAAEDFRKRLDELKQASEVNWSDVMTDILAVGAELNNAANNAADTLKVAFRDISPGALERGSASAASAIAKAQRDSQGNKTEQAMLKQLQLIAQNTMGGGLLPANL
jgi:hypothetical protein